MADYPPGSPEPSKGVVSDACGAAVHAARHIGALAELFVLELQEYAHSQQRRMRALLVGGVLLLCAYLTLCAIVVALLHPVVGLLWALGIVAAFNAVAAGLAMAVAAARRPAGFAPATLQEIRADIQCIKLYTKENRNS